VSSGRLALLTAGFDVLTSQEPRRVVMRAIGAGGSVASGRGRASPRRLGMRIAFVGFSGMLPRLALRGPRRAGDPAATPALIAAASASRAEGGRRRDPAPAGGVERARGEHARERACARRTGRTWVTGGSPRAPADRAAPAEGRRVQPRQLRLKRVAGTTRPRVLGLKPSGKGVEGRGPVGVVGHLGQRHRGALALDLGGEPLCRMNLQSAFPSVLESELNAEAHRCYTARKQQRRIKTE
jgi:hypothetical protein